MRLHLFDWTLIASVLGGLFLLALHSRRYTRNVTDYLAANRCAGRYLLTMSDGMAALGAIAVIANFQKFYEAGFAAAWWGFMMGPLAMVAALSGWVVYRYRQTRVLTMAQFFEMRYNRRFRVFSGILCFISGVLNYGVFPGITAKFLIHFCGLPQSVDVFGIALPTFQLLMGLILTVAVLIALFGGFIAIMVTDLAQSQIVYATFLVMAFYLLYKFSWADISSVLSVREAGHSLIDPFDQSGIKSFNIWFFLIFGFKIFYNCLGWQSNQSYNCAAKSPHEAHMARILGGWRDQTTYLLFMLAPICAYVFLHHPAHAESAGQVNAMLAGLGDEQLRSQLTVTQVLSAVLPMGLTGLFCLSMILAALSTDDTALHAWGSIFVQDILMPLRKKPLEPKAHMRYLRLSVVGVAVFAFLWSSFFPIKDYLLMYFLLTGTVYLGGSGAVIVGGLYWKRGTTAGACAAMIAGCACAVLGISLQVAWEHSPFLLQFAGKFPLGGVWLAMTSYLVSITAYVGVSLATCKEPFNLDQLLHRGSYADPGEAASAPSPVGDTPGWRSRFWRKLGITAEFTPTDKCIFYGKFVWTMFWFAAFVVGVVCHYAFGISPSSWLRWWHFKVILSIIVASGTLVWFVCGGTRDAFRLFRHLRDAKRDEADDGSVTAEGEGSPVRETPIHSVPTRKENEELVASSTN